jgi:hypothetical protein
MQGARIHCPFCQRLTRIPVRPSSRLTLRCPHCREMFTVERTDWAAEVDEAVQTHLGFNRWFGLAAIFAMAAVAALFVSGPTRETTTPAGPDNVGPSPQVAETASRSPTAASDPLGDRTCDSSEVLRPGSGAEIGGRFRGGRGRLDVTNGTDSEAVVVLTQADVGKRAIYIRAGESGAITSIPIGTYSVQFQLGDHWLRPRRFCNMVATSAFDESLISVKSRSRMAPALRASS